ncbi:HIRAN domain-containing protein [Streptacidiphilus sp. N1-10]|uniref:HIRAN domain-containing protein n=1 Tax=Streptacidiphilus jeojiensis TaxID=3229225 RepID=A0ABV6XLC5_9ACTN
MYVPADGPADRFVPAVGRMPRLHLVDYQGGLRLCEDATGLLVGPTDRRLQFAGLHVDNLRGMSHYQPAARSAELSPRKMLRLVPEPENAYDPHAIAIYSAENVGPVGYVNKQKARRWSKLIADGVRLRAISLRGTRAGASCDAATVLVADPKVIDHLLSPRPVGLPVPLFLQQH